MQFCGLILYSVVLVIVAFGRTQKYRHICVVPAGCGGYHCFVNLLPGCPLSDTIIGTNPGPLQLPWWLYSIILKSQLQADSRIKENNIYLDKLQFYPLNTYNLVKIMSPCMQIFIHIYPQYPNLFNIHFVWMFMYNLLNQSQDG